MDRRVELSFFSLLIIGSLGFITLDIHYGGIITTSIFLFIPGYLILKIFRTKLQNFGGVLILSFGLSLSFLMIIGWVWNEIGFLLGIERPLNPFYLSVIFVSSLIILAMIVYRDNYQFYSKNIIVFPSLNIKEYFISISSVFLILFSLYSSLLMRYHTYSFFAFLTYLMIPFLFIMTWYFKSKINNKLYPLVVFSSGLALTILFVFKTNYFYGDDIYASYYFADFVLGRGHWNILAESNLFSALSVTLLPPVLASLSNLNLVLIFKILITLSVSLIPLTVYYILNRYIDDFYALIGCLFYISSIYFINAGAGLRTNCGVLFVAIFIYVISRFDIFGKKVPILLSMVVFSIVISHYSTAYFFIIISTVAFFWIKIYNKFHKSEFGKSLNIKIILIFYFILYAWNAYIIYPFHSAIHAIRRGVLGLLYGKEVHNYGRIAGEGVGGGFLNYYIPEQIEYLSMWMIFGCIAIGFFYLLFLSIKRENIKSPFKNISSKNFIGSGYFAFCVGSGFVLGVLMLPGTSPGMGIHRVWGSASIFLAIPFIIGSSLVFERFKKKQFLTILVLVIYFIGVSGCSWYMHQSFNEDISYNLQREKTLKTENTSHEKAFDIYEEEIQSYRWLNHHKNTKVDIFGDHGFKYRILSNGFHTREQNISYSYKLFSNYSLDEFNGIDGYVYLRSVNLNQKEYTTTSRYEYTNFSSIYDKIENDDGYSKIYSNGESEIWSRNKSL